MSDAWPLSFSRNSTRAPEDGALQVDITSTGTARARKRHSRVRFSLFHAYLDATESATLQAFCEAHDGALVTVTWTDGSSYEGVLSGWSVRRIAGPYAHATAEIRGAEKLA
jgi:hypothetical protein